MWQSVELEMVESNPLGFSHIGAYGRFARSVKPNILPDMGGQERLFLPLCRMMNGAYQGIAKYDEMTIVRTQATATECLLLVREVTKRALGLCLSPAPVQRP
jgi:hypothetical protein